MGVPRPRCTRSRNISTLPDGLSTTPIRSRLVSPSQDSPSGSSLRRSRLVRSLRSRTTPQLPGQLPSIWRTQPGLQIFGGAIEVLLFNSRDQTDDGPVWGACAPVNPRRAALVEWPHLRWLRLPGLDVHR